jgi:putative ABC transport system permease protein
MALRKLVFSNFRVHKVRTALTVAAIALSVSLVVSVSTGYSSARGAARKLLTEYMSTSDLMVRRSKGDPHGTFTDAIAKELAAAPQVESALGRYETETTVLGPSGLKVPGRPVDLTGIIRPLDTGVENLAFESGKWFDGADGNFAVIDQVLSERLKTKAGGTISLGLADGPVKLQVTGVVHKPGPMAAEEQEIYIPLHTMQNLLHHPGQINRILITLKHGEDIDAFKNEWEPKIEKIDPLVTMRSTGDLHKQLDEDMQGLSFLSYLGGTVSMLAAMFIVFSALSMGVGERQRTLAMLRAIGAMRWQLALLVMLEGVMLSLAGVVIGAPIGWLFVKSLATWKPDFFAAGVVVDWIGVSYAAVGSTAAALTASLLPAWSATRVDPLEAMAPFAAPAAARLPLWPTIIGLLCICIDPFFAFGPVPKSVRYFGHFIAGLPGIFAGFFLLSPLVVWLVERLGSWIIARLVGVQPGLLRQQLSSGIWRVAGTCSALMVGLAILIVMQTQGHSLLSSWHLPNKFPDVFIYSFDGLTPEQQQRLAHTPGIKPGELMPVAITTAILSNENIDPAGRNLIPTAAMFFGVEPDIALKMLELDFRDEKGHSVPQSQQAALNHQAAEDLKKGRHIIITDEYMRLLGKKRGDKLVIATPVNGNVEYTIAGVVWSPGVDVIVTMYDMQRQFDQRTASSMFGSLEDAKRDFGVTDVTLYAANLDYGVNKTTLEKQMEREAEGPRKRGATEPATTQSALASAFKWLGQGKKAPKDARDAGMGGAVFHGVKELLGLKGMRVGDVRAIKYQITNGLEKLLLLLSTVAFASMAVAALGVANTIMASIRSRRWQFGVLRSIGLTRSQLLRLVLCEGLLIGIASCVLGLAAGFLMSLDANALSLHLLGLLVNLSVPWKMVDIGLIVVLSTSIIASLWPAVSVATSQPLSLLQAGRAAV